MTHQCIDKIVNPDLARAALHGAHIFGEFKVIVQLAKPRSYPSYMTVIGPYSPGHIRARIACDDIKMVANDPNILSVELYEHVT